MTAPSTAANINAEMHVGGQITGTVTDALTHAPLANAQACIVGGFFNCATTNAAGEYTISSLSPGAYSVEFSPPAGANYVPSRRRRSWR